jgi:TonB family protein
VARVADAVDYAHRHGIVHRDIKPANVMLLEDGGVKVMDFGVARLEHSTLTALGTVVGSVRYMAPEQMMGERVDGRADIFSLAAVAYELLTGQAPFPGKTITEVVSRVVHGTHVPPQKADHRLPEALNAVFARAFALRPADRFARAMDFARELEAAAEPALDLQVATGFDPPHAGRTEVPAATAAPAPTAGPALTLRAPAPAPPGETVFLGGSREKGQLVLDVEPAGFVAEVDGRLLPEPTAAHSLPFGVHSLRLMKEGHEDLSCHFELHATHPHLRLSAALPPERPREPEDSAAPDEVVPPRRIAGGLPALPEGEGLRGSAVVDVYVGKAGEVLRVEEVSGDSRLTRALEETVKRWRFEPAERAGAKVAARLRVQHVFAT